MSKRDSSLQQVAAYREHKPPRARTVVPLLAISQKRSYLDSKIGSMLVRTAGERKSNSKVNVAVRAGEIAACLYRVSVSLQ